MPLLQLTCTTVLFSVSASLAAFAQTAPSGDPRGNAAEEIIDRTRDDGSLDALKQQKKKADEKQQLDPDEAEEKLGTGSAILDSLPSDANLEKLRAQIEAEPNNLDHYFAYAQMATKLNQPDEAARTYETMLQMAPDLDRVRLDLGVAYIQAGRLDEARAMLLTVLDRQPPEQVQANIRSILAKIDGELNEHGLSGSVAFGVNRDTNTNSAPETDSILIFDTEIPLEGDDQAQDDIQLFATAQLNHSYKPRWAKGESLWTQWNSSFSAYQAEQRDVESLDLKLINIETGPQFMLKENGLRINPTIGYTHIVLDNHTYLQTTQPELAVEYPLSQQWLLSGSVKHEWRDFQNSPEVSTYADRTGSASQIGAGLTYLYTPVDIFSLELLLRRERTRQAYFDNDQWGGTLSYTRLFEEDYFLNGQLGYRDSDYEGADPLISARIRQDEERSAGLTLGKKLNDTLTATAGYQYRDVSSNILNYDYDNHRISALISARF